MTMDILTKTAAFLIDPERARIPAEKPLDIDAQRLLTLMKRNKIPLVRVAEYSTDWHRHFLALPIVRNALESEEARVLRLRQAYIEVREHLEAKGIENILIKSIGYYPHETDNLDMLVRWEHLDSARSVLLSLGYIEQRRYKRRDKFYFTKFHAGQEMTSVHLHTRVSWGTPFLSERLLWERCHLAHDPTIMMPSPDDEVLITIAHSFYEDSEIKIWDLAKIAYSLKNGGLDWDYIFWRARERGWFSGLALALKLYYMLDHELYIHPLFPSEVVHKCKNNLRLLDGTLIYEKLFLKSIKTAPIRIFKLFTKAQAYVTAWRDHEINLAEKMENTRLLTVWGIRSIFGIKEQHRMLITFSGPDGSGKTIQARAVQNALNVCETSAKYVWIRIGDTPWLNFIKKLVRSSKGLDRKLNAGPNGKFPIAIVRELWKWISIVDLIVRYNSRVRFPLMFQKVVICDRYYIDSLVDLAYRVGNDVIQQKSYAIRLLVFTIPRPDIAYFLSIPANELSMRRVGQLDLEQCAQQESLYRQVANSSSLIYLDATVQFPVLNNQIVHQVLETYFKLF